MSRPDRIEPGDYVEITFSTPGLVEGIVLSIPCATGDAWIIKPVPRESVTEYGGWISRDGVVYVQNYDTMLLVKKALAKQADLDKYKVES